MPHQRIQPLNTVAKIRNAYQNDILPCKIVLRFAFLRDIPDNAHPTKTLARLQLHDLMIRNCWPPVLRSLRTGFSPRSDHAQGSAWPARDAPAQSDKALFEETANDQQRHVVHVSSMV